MQEINLIDNPLEPRANNAPIIINEGLETNLLAIATEDELSRQLGSDCRMNNEVSLGKKETSYRCPNCPDRMNNICLYCLENCHKSHINNLPSDLFKSHEINFEEIPCECAMHNHNVTCKIKDSSLIDTNEEINCPFNKIFALVKPKYVYKRKDNQKIYCLYCIYNFTVFEEERPSNKDSKSISFMDLMRHSVNNIDENKKTDRKMENVGNDDLFYQKYDRIEVDYSKPFPNCECNDEFHKHQILSENIDNLYKYMTEIVDKNKLNLDKLSYEILNNEVSDKIIFQTFYQIQDLIMNEIKDVKEFDTSNVKKKLGVEDNLTNINLDDKLEWDVYLKSIQLFELASKRLKNYNFFEVSWLNEKIKKYFSFKTLSKLLLCKSNLVKNFFKIQIFSTKIHRRAYFTNIPHNLLINENTSFINRQIYTSKGSSNTESIFNEGKKIVENIFYLLDAQCDNEKIDHADFNELFIEALKILKVIMFYKTNDIDELMNLFRKIENNLSIVREKKENQTRVVHCLSLIIEKLLTYFNDNKFLDRVKDSKRDSQFNYAFLSSCEYNKEMISTLFNFDLKIDEMNPYIQSNLFYDILVNEKDYYAESVENFLNTKKDWRKIINKEYNNIIHGLAKAYNTDEIKDFFKSITMNIKGLLNNEVNELQFLITCNQLMNKLVKLMQKRENSFGEQISFFQNKFYFRILFLMGIQQSISKFILNAEIDGTDKKNEIINISSQINESFNNLLLLLTKDNPLTCSVLFSKIVVSLLIKKSTDDLSIYVKLLEIMKNYKYKIDTSFLTLHMHTIYADKFNPVKFPKESLNLLTIYILILKVASERALLESNNIIAADLRFFLENNGFQASFESLETKYQKKIVEAFFSCVHRLQSEYFYIFTKFIEIDKISEKLHDIDLDPKLRRIFTQIYTDYFIKNYFSIITIDKFFENENMITSNLIENLMDDKQKKKFLTTVGILSVNTGRRGSIVIDESEDLMPKVLVFIFDNLEKYKYYNEKFKNIFEKNFKLTVSFFKNVILLPTVYALYKLTYFPKNYAATQKYDLYKLIYLYLQCYKYFITDIISKFNIAEFDTCNIWYKFVSETSNLDEMRKNVDDSLKIISEKSGKVLDMKLLFDNFIQNSKNFNLIRKKFLEKEENEDTDSKNDDEEGEENEEEIFALSYYTLCLHLNLFKKLKKVLDNYLELKENFENNVFNQIYQDEHLEDAQKRIALDLLYKLSFRKNKAAFKLQEQVGYQFQSGLNRGQNYVEVRRQFSLFTSIKRRGAVVGKGAPGSERIDKTEEYGEYYNPYLSPYIESKSQYLGIIDKCFKSNPTLWQEVVVEMAIASRDLIYIFIIKQLPFLLQFIFIEFNKIDTKDTKYYDNFINILEFLRLLCEDHNPLFQTLLINFEKAIGKVDLFSNDKCFFIPFIARIPVFVLLNIKHYISKKEILSGFNTKKVEYFNPLLGKITDFLIEIIQGTYPENFNDITTSVDDFSRSGIEDYIRRHYQFFDYLDTDSSYEAVINYFFNFFNSFVEEDANPMEIKIPLMNIFPPKKLINVSIDAFKNCIYKYVDKNIKNDCSKELIQVFINDYENIMEDTSFSLCLTIYLYIIKANSFKEKALGDKYQQILSALKELVDSEEEFEENSNLLLRREYYKFCTELVKETEVSFTQDKSREDKEVYKYRHFYCKTYMKQVVEFRNKNCSKELSLNNVFFIVHPDSLYLKSSDTELFLQNASYDNSNAKLTCLLNYYPEINTLIELRKTLSKEMLTLSQINYYQMEIYNALWAVFTNVCLAFRTPGGFIHYIMLLSAFLHIIALCLLILNWLVFYLIKESKRPKNENSNKCLLIFTSFFNPEVFPFTWTLLFGILGCIGEKWRFLFSLQLFPIFTLFDTMKSVLEAVKVRYNQFLSTGFLLVILILFYAALTFYFFRYDSEGNEICGSYLNCFTYLFNYGIRAGGVPFEVKILGQPGFYGEFIFNWVFYFIVILIILNIVNGIIVDKFQDLREKNNEVYEQKENVCFICSLHRSKFETKGIDFEYHLDQEHNISNYLRYLCKIERTDEHDLNSIDFQVFMALKQKKIEFFPIEKAKSIEMTKSGK